LFAVPASFVSSVLATIVFALAILLVYGYALDPGFQATAPLPQARQVGSDTCHHCGEAWSPS